MYDISSQKKLANCLKFKGTWRSYQKRVLDELQHHLADKKLNVVAAPGAGKTTLGIEIIRQLNKPTLILTPTLTIKNQWVQRIIDGFVVDKSDVNLISSDIRNISPITVSTYQSIHAISKNKQEMAKFILRLKENNISTLVFDEAHHLRTEWYATLDYLCKKLNDKNFTSVSLTATPPYDVSLSEWNNYHNLCGAVDAEISIPELVKNGDLCPHQDLIYFSNLSKEEEKIIFDFEDSRNDFFNFLDKESDFLYLLKTSEFVNNLEDNIELIYEDTDFTISLISYLLKIDELSTEARVLTEFLDLDINHIPKFNYEIAEILFNGILGKFEKKFNNVPTIKAKLKEFKLLQSPKKVDFTGKVNFKTLFARSKNKLDAIYEITKFENKIMGTSLREVVLLDYIGKTNTIGLNILSVFDRLYSSNINIGILTGSLVVIPQSAKECLYRILQTKNIDCKNVLTTDFKKDYLRIETYGNVDIVSIITDLFSQGCINVLIGTQALLGEGWDSPCVNSLIIASTVGSFMLSNQMRGRALRIDKNNPHKTANIWHLVSISNEGQSNTDFYKIEKRFYTFEGISYTNNKIQNGLNRLGLDWNAISHVNCKKNNKLSFERAANRLNLNKMWQQVFNESEITESNIVSQVYEVLETEKAQLPIICTKFAKLPFGMLLNNLIEYFSNVYTQKEQLKIAKLVLKSLCQAEIIKTNHADLITKIIIDKNKCSYLTLLGCTNYERNIFIKSFEELFRIPEKSRYILLRQNKYLAVPEILATKKRNVEIFVRNLETKFGYFDTIFTKNPNGRKELLKARYNRHKMASIKRSRIWV